MVRMYLPYEAKVVDTRFETEDKSIKSIELEFLKKEDREKFQYMPGQFAQFSIYGVGEAPFGMASSPLEGETVKFAVSKVGVVTSRIHELECGDVVGLRGPLGNYYPVEKFKGHNVVVIGGGFAFTTLRSLILYILHPQNRGDFKRLIVVCGARTPGMLLYKEELAEWSKRNDLELHLTVDRGEEGWQGKVGLVPDIVKEVAPPAEGSYAVVCGPPLMIKYSLIRLEELNFCPEQVYNSLEMRMKCGTGKCGRCNIGPKYVCKDGPVFSLAELKKLPAEY